MRADPTTVKDVKPFASHEQLDVPALTRSSLSALEPLDAGVLLPGHGEPFLRAPADALARVHEADDS